MRHLILSAAIPALLLGACATAPVATGVDEVVVSTNDSPPPHFPRDLTPAGVAAADDHLALEQVDGAEAMAFVRASNERALATLTGDPRYEPFRQQAEAILRGQVIDALDDTQQLARKGQVGELDSCRECLLRRRIRQHVLNETTAARGAGKADHAQAFPR